MRYLLLIFWSVSDRAQPCYQIIFYPLLIFYLGVEVNEKPDKHLKDVVAYGHILSTYIFIIVNFLLASIFFHYKYLCGTLYPSSHIHSIHYFMAPSSIFLNNVTYKSPWYATYNMPSLTGTTPHV